MPLRCEWIQFTLTVRPNRWMQSKLEYEMVLRNRNPAKLVPSLSQQLPAQLEVATTTSTCMSSPTQLPSNYMPVSKREWKQLPRRIVTTLCILFQCTWICRVPVALLGDVNLVLRLRTVCVIPSWCLFWPKTSSIKVRSHFAWTHHWIECSAAFLLCTQSMGSLVFCVWNRCLTVHENPY